MSAVLIQLTSEGKALKKKAATVPPCILDATEQTVDELARLKAEITTLRGHSAGMPPD